MAGLDIITGESNTDLAGNPKETTPTDVTATGKPAAAKSGYLKGTPTVSGDVAIEPSILENMQRLLAEKEAQRGSFMENLKDAKAWFTGMGATQAEALKNRNAEREAQSQNIFEMQNYIAQAKTAQEQAKREAARMRTPQAGATGVGGAGAAPTGRSIGSAKVPDYIQARIDELIDANQVGAAKKLEEEWFKDYSKSQLNPEWAKPIDYMRQMPDGTWKLDKAPLREAYAYSQQNPQHPQNQAIVKQGDKISGTTTPTAEAPKQEGTTTKAPVSVRNNNPGNLVDAKTGQIRTFDTPEEGEAALDADVEAKLSGNSAAYKQRFGKQPITPERLAEVWAPAAAKGNSPESTKNYGAAIAKELGIAPGDVIPNTPEAIEAVKRAITRFEAGPGSGNVNAPAPTTTAKTAPAAPAAAPAAPVALNQSGRPAWSDVEAEAKKNLAIQEGRGKTDVELEKDFLTNTKPVDVSNRLATYGQIKNLVKDDPSIAGVVAGKGYQNAVATMMAQGINTPWGSINVKGLEDAIYQTLPGTTTEQIAKRRELAGYLARAELEAAKLVQGQGSVSDGERAIIKSASLNISDPAEVIYKKAKMLERREELNKALRSAYKGGKGYASFSDFMDDERSPAYALIQSYENDLKGILNEKVTLNKGVVKTTPSPNAYADQNKEAAYQEWKKKQKQNKAE